MSEQVVTQAAPVDNQSNIDTRLQQDTADVESADNWDDQQSLQEMADAEALEDLYPEEPEIEPAPEPEAIAEETQAGTPADQDDTAANQDEPRYSVRELTQLSQVSQTVNQIKAAKATLAGYEQAIAQAGGDVLKAAGGDRAKEVVARTEIRELQDFIQSATGGVQKFAQEYYAGAEKKWLDSNRAEMVSKLPELEDTGNRRELAGWLLDQGFSVDEVSAISPKQAATAWRIFQKDKASEPGRKFKIPKKAMRKSKTTPKQKVSVNDNETIAEMQHRLGIETPASLLYGPPEKRSKPVTMTPQDDVLEILYPSSAA